MAAALHDDNLRRIRWVALAMPLLNLLFLTALLTATPHTEPRMLHWQEALRPLHLAMAPVFLLLGLGAVWLLRRPAAPSLLRAAWARLTAVAALGFAIAFVAADQRVGGNITTFTLGAILTGVVVVMPPLQSALLYIAALVAFWIVIGATQVDAVLLLAAQLNGITGATLGWVLAAITWRQALVNKRLTLQLQRAATTDSLTGLANRKETVRLVNEELRRGARHGHPTSLLLLDLDHFKQVNDRLGHPGGDRVLKHAAAVLEQSLRAQDRIGRLGGEEFLVLLPQTDAQGARRLAERVRQRLAEALAEHGEITCSIGFITSETGEESGFDQLYVQADHALYRAKAGGRNRCEVAA
ncbi:MAG TPA: GGDEF domain-containing protein [Rubrivivax sp.]|nr:GGDEF domain-containing protein [Burkholderiales bacterium]HNT39018.1 GGDEF domain-containing protein [Rubrivivax sp.]